MALDVISVTMHARCRLYPSKPKTNIMQILRVIGIRQDQNW